METPRAVAIYGNAPSEATTPSQVPSSVIRALQSAVDVAKESLSAAEESLRWAQEIRSGLDLKEKEKKENEERLGSLRDRRLEAEEAGKGEGHLNIVDDMTRDTETSLQALRDLLPTELARADAAVESARRSVENARQVFESRAADLARHDNTGGPRRGG